MKLNFTVPEWFTLTVSSCTTSKCPWARHWTVHLFTQCKSLWMRCQLKCNVNVNLERKKILRVKEDKTLKEKRACWVIWSNRHISAVLYIFWDHLCCIKSKPKIFSCRAESCCSSGCWSIQNCSRGAQSVWNVWFERRGKLNPIFFYTVQSIMI